MHRITVDEAKADFANLVERVYAEGMSIELESDLEQKHAKIAKSLYLRALCDLLFIPHDPRHPTLSSPTHHPNRFPVLYAFREKTPDPWLFFVANGCISAGMVMPMIPIMQDKFHTLCRLHRE